MQSNISIKELINKYGTAVPRYTSYPTAPEWKDEYNHDVFLDALKRSNDSDHALSLYLHLPFCESQCYFCGCNVVISPEHGIERDYLKKLYEEIEYYGQFFDSNKQVKQMAWGGGTPTFLTPKQVTELTNHIRKHFPLYEQGSNADYEYAIEVDPRVTNKDHLQALWESGFNRLSMGIQDFNPETQEAINRIQSYADIELTMQTARSIGFKSINFDLIYGLPDQNLESFIETIDKVKSLDPDRIALFNYAHLPEFFPHQKKYIDESKLPSAEEKIQIFNKAIEEFENHGYVFIGIDHFAKQSDNLVTALKEKTLYRNFQGYTTHSECDLIGFGITSISDIQGVYKQNPKKLNNYYQNFKSAEKFKLCSQDDRERREIIKQIMCNRYAVIDSEKYQQEIEALQDFAPDGLLSINQLGPKTELEITEIGKFFVRNIASYF